jgi:hypothetical protein
MTGINGRRKKTGDRERPKNCRRIVEEIERMEGGGKPGIGNAPLDLVMNIDGRGREGNIREKRSGIGDAPQKL